MNEQMIKSLEEQFRRKGVDDWVKDAVPDWDGLSNHKLAVALVDKVVKARSRPAAGGSIDKLDKFAFSTPVTMESTPLPADKGGVWILGIDENGTVKDADGKVLKISPLAHIIAMPEWEKVNVGHIDHKNENGFDVKLHDTRYSLGHGMFQNVDSSDDNINRLFASNAFRASPEIVFDERDVKDGVIQRYRPVGVGAMYDGAPLGATHTENPTRDSIPAQGGTDMSDEKDADKEAENQTTEGKPDAENLETPDDTSEANKELEGLKKQLEEQTRLNEELLLKMGDFKEVAEVKEALEQKLKETHLSKLPEELRDIYAKAPLDEIERAALLLSHTNAQLRNITPNILEKPRDTGEGPIVVDKQTGYVRFSEEHQKMMDERVKKALPSASSAKPSNQVVSGGLPLSYGRNQRYEN